MNALTNNAQTHSFWGLLRVRVINLGDTLKDPTFKLGESLKIKINI